MSASLAAVYGPALVPRPPMATETPAKGTRETWRDWMPEGSPEPADLMTREAFLARLNGVGVDAVEGDLRFWEYHGVLPRAIRRWHDGASRVLYPRWMIMAVALLRDFQDLGFSLRDIAPRLRALVRDAIGWGDTAGLSPAQADAALRQRARDLARFALLESIDNELAELGRRYAVVTRQDVGTVRVTFLAPDGQEIDRYEARFLTPAEQAAVAAGIHGAGSPIGEQQDHPSNP